MLRLFGSTMMAGFLVLGWAAAPARKASAKKVAVNSSSKTSSQKASSRASKSSKASAKTSSKTRSKSAARRGSRGNASVRPAITWRNRQLAPTPARYREIQEALAAKGFLQPENVTGVWNQASIDALKRFQTGQNIESTGKINSLSLIALGLGPKRETPVVKPPAPPQVPGAFEDR